MSDQTLMVKSVFGPTIQGEGTYTGLVVKFLRLSNCNRWSGFDKDRAKAICWFCDTDFVNGERLNHQEIIQKLDDLGLCKNLVISGGEPLLQLKTDLLTKLKNAGYFLHLETNGSIEMPDEMFDLFTHVTMSPKQSRSKTKLKKCHDLKILFDSKIPGLDPNDFRDYDCSQRWIQPLDSNDKEINLKNSIAFVLKNPEWKLSIQTHKLIGVQ